jgi:2-polyprenyl-3-methyl-5-hydroxy-6-metoxy-1,4-benzoquinol methylase
LGVLDSVSLLKPAYRVYEALQTMKGGSSARIEEADGLPLPPASLRTLVAGTPDPVWFLESGRTQATMIAEALERHGKPIAEVDYVLDFGCGCGRIIRHWAGLGKPEIHGSDYNQRLVRWCVANLRFAQFSANELAPPLDYPEELFDAVYAISIVTHLPEELEQAWIAELSRILKPGGLLLLTTHGASYLERLAPEERERYEAGEVVVRWAAVAGTNLCTTFHPEAYVRERLATELELLEFTPEGGAVGSPRQDLAVFKRPPSTQPA